MPTHPIRPVARRTFLRHGLAAAGLLGGIRTTFADDSPADRNLRSTLTPEALSVRLGDGPEIARYHRVPPADTPIPSAGFFHPLATPSGVVITDLSPDDHRHHRGVFLGWVEMHGAKDADFWGWGEPAPVKDRRIVNRGIRSARIGGPVAMFNATNRWEAEGVEILGESLAARLRVEGDLTVLDLRYQLTPAADLTLARWAFSGFCLRMRKDGTGTVHDPKGPVSLPEPRHTDPDSDAPDAPWYAVALTLPDGRRAGGAVLSHPDNPPTRWHNPPSLRMLNPCIVAPGSLHWPARKAVTLRYQVVAFDGPLPADRLNALAAEYTRAR